MNQVSINFVAQNKVSKASIDIEQFRFLHKMQATFRGEAHGVVGDLQYTTSIDQSDPVQGANLWEAFLKVSKDYYPLPNEIKLIRTKAGRLIQDKKSPVFIVDFGPGPKQAVLNKTIPIMRHFGNAAGYAAIDGCMDYVVSSCNVVGKKHASVPLYGYQADYLEDDINLPEGTRKIGLFFGGTIANFEGHPTQGLPAERVIALLKRMRELLGSDGSLFITNDSNQDEESILSSYLHPLQIAFGSNLMHRVKRDLPVSKGFDPCAWRYEPVWHAANHQLCHTVVCERTQDFWLGEEYFKINVGERFILNNSFKYPVSKIKEWAHEAGFNSHQHVMDHQNRQALHLMHS